MRKAFDGLKMGEAEPLTDAQKKWLEYRDGETVWMTLWGKYKAKEMNLATIIQSFKYFMDVRGYQYLNGIGWVKKEDIPRIGIIRFPNGDCAIQIEEEVTEDTYHVGRKTLTKEVTVITCRYADYLKREESKRNLAVFNDKQTMYTIIDLFGVEGV